MIRPTLQFLSQETVDRVIEEAIELLQDPGVQVHSQRALSLLGEHGAQIDRDARVARIPADLAHRAVESAPQSFYLYDFAGNPVVHYGGDDVHFDPGSAAIEILDYQAKTSRAPVTADLLRFVKLVDSLDALDAVATSLVCGDVPEEIADLYRLYLVLLYARKPVVTGAFAVKTWHRMKDMLVAVAGSEAALAERPIAVFDVCPSPPLLWSEITCENLMDCAQYHIPAELVSMPLTGATGPATLLGSIVQHAAENLSGVVIHQLTAPGAPIVWGGSPAAFDMRAGTTPMGAIETMMIDCSYAQVGKHLGFPTHAYLGMSDAKIVDAQCGFESGIGAVLGALAGINMISGPGMLDFESCFSLEKLAIDAEIVGMAKRLVAGVEERERPLALDLIRQVGHAGNFLATPHTRRWFRQELYIPSDVVDRDFRRTWEAKGSKDSVERAHERVEKLVAAYQPPERSTELVAELEAITLRAARAAGFDRLPPRQQLD
ncbi:MAG: trimethylamine methyltransferase family protein [Anaerolineae bacterium]|nr:trimethylamine methyltransferase family protein [Anaerolineae bacterium]